ncbi:MAG: hypothetical protein ACPIOQ_83460, partial [Promethearchaeia archaeon]
VFDQGLNVTGKKLGKFAYFCVCCGKRFTFPVQDLVQHCQVCLCARALMHAHGQGSQPARQPQ